MPPLDRAVTPGPGCIKMTYLLLQQALYVTSLPGPHWLERRAGTQSFIPNTQTQAEGEYPAEDK